MPLAFLTVGRLRLLGAALPPGEGLAALFPLPLLGADGGGVAAAAGGGGGGGVGGREGGV